MNHHDVTEAQLVGLGFDKITSIDFGQAAFVTTPRKTVCFKLRGGYGEIWIRDELKESRWKRFLAWSGLLGS